MIMIKQVFVSKLSINYLTCTFIFGLAGTLISVLMRVELYSSGNRIIAPENQNFYNVSITMHGLLMIFFLIMHGQSILHYPLLQCLYRLLVLLT
mmetsp:Transcript_66372/g.175756  ORF Transcript_66372/g.175756 Transcript_66372/m.175756 type:complete len:94 (+) Transcript_66372:92-373(+)